MIELNKVTKKYKEGKQNELTALDTIDLKIEDGEMIAIIGRSGAGKSTLIHIIGCLDNVTSGVCSIDGTDTKNLSDARLAKLRNEKIGILLQDFGLINEETAIQNVMMPLFFSKTPLFKIKSKAKRALEISGIIDLQDQVVATMSGGQKQRVALARALVNKPSVLLCDEPTGALDIETTTGIMNQLDVLNKNGVTIIIVTHDMKVAAYCERKIELSDGKIIQNIEIT